MTTTEGFGQVPGGHGQAQPVQTCYLQCAWDAAPEPVQIELNVPMMRATPAVELDQALILPSGWPTLTAARFLPQAVAEYSAVPDDGENARPALKLFIEGRSQRIERWLIADDAAHNRLTSFIARWRYMAAPDRAARDALLEQFKQEATREPQILVRERSSKSIHQLSLRPGEWQTVEALASRVMVREFMPHFALDAVTHKPVNQSSQRVNPAASVTLERDGRTVDVWLFALHPDRGARAARDLGLDVRLDCSDEAPSAEPDFVLVTTSGGDHEVWGRVNGEVSTGALILGEAVSIGCSRYTFRAERFLPKARFVEDYKPGSGPDALPALCVETVDADGSRTPVWLKFGRPARVTVSPSDSTLTLTLSRKPLAAQGAHP